MSGPEKFAENVVRSEASLEKTKKLVEAGKLGDSSQEAAANAEDIIAMLQQAWRSRDFAPEQCVFALALAVINFREGMPPELGGKEMFDRVAEEARRYYDTNK